MYYRPVGTTELGNSSLQGMVRELRRRHDDRFSEYFSPESLQAFNEQIEGRFSGIGLTVIEVQKGLRVASVFPRSPAQEAGIDPGRHDRLGRGRVDRRREQQRGDEEDQGAGRHAGDDRRAATARAARSAS